MGDEWSYMDEESKARAADRARINVGWKAAPVDTDEQTDLHIAEYSQNLGTQQYNFITYPVGGVTRGFWISREEEVPPPLLLPDLQLQNHLWETYVNGCVSEWIDCDSDQEWLAELSQKEIEKELNYACYLGLRSITIRLRHTLSPRLAAIVSKWLWTKNTSIAFWIFVPSDVSSLSRVPGCTRDSWEVWADFRTSCANFSSHRLIPGIHIMANLDEEFVDPRLLGRWKGETVYVLAVSVDAFVSSSGSSPSLPPAHHSLIRSLWTTDYCRVLIQADVPVADKAQFATCIRDTVRNVCKERSANTPKSFLDEANVDYVDVLQAPLQPLADHLDSHVYNTFEQDKIKYIKYREAIFEAIKDIGEKPLRPSSLVLYVLGAGRGPLVTASIMAERLYNEKLRWRKDRLTSAIFVVEKNPNAVITLEHCNRTIWGNRCTIIECDMRDLPRIGQERGLPQPDIVVSELLGSWGDNELSPECLSAARPFFHESTVSIPSSYSSFVCPIMSLHMYHTISSSKAGYWQSGVQGQGRAVSHPLPDGSYSYQYKNGTRLANLDQLYVVFLSQFFPVGDIREIFSFHHPGTDEKVPDMEAEQEFPIDIPCEVMAFAGYFEATLYKNVTLSTHPSRHTPTMVSWFPALLPLRTPQRLHPGDKIKLVVRRLKDDGGVWYEWNVVVTKENGEVHLSPVQNEHGESYYMRT